MSLPKPKKVPELGFYYHYKRDSNGSINNYAYEVVGVGFHTEEAREGEEHFVIYRPLYISSVYEAEKEFNIPCFDARPLEMWMGDVEINGNTQKRFTKINDSKIIEELEKIKRDFYENSHR